MKMDISGKNRFLILTRFSDRADRLMNKTAQLLEYAEQVKDAYQSRLDARQNRSMAVSDHHFDHFPSADTHHQLVRDEFSKHAGAPEWISRRDFPLSPRHYFMHLDL